MLPRELQMDVTREDIRNGKRRSYGECPIALAVVRKLEEIGETHWQVSVRPSGNITLRGMLADVWYTTGMDTYQFINRLDVEGKKAVKPIQFTAYRD